MSTINQSTTFAEAAQPRRLGRLFRWLGLGLGALVLLAAIAFGLMLARMNYVPADLNTSTSLVSDKGLYRVSYIPQFEPVPINQIQSWTLHLETADGRPVEKAEIRVDGDMPQHGHGLPTRPQVTEYLGNGDYRVEGLKFHMPGWWIVEFDITAEGQTDHVTFNLTL
ncbi:MAG: FixH family protein [Anaerolineae bacterium]|nr:FixH family protein [Anaerolineae bacterium]